MHNLHSCTDSPRGIHRQAESWGRPGSGSLGICQGLYSKGSEKVAILGGPSLHCPFQEMGCLLSDEGSQGEVQDRGNGQSDVRVSSWLLWRAMQGGGGNKLK